MAELKYQMNFLGNSEEVSVDIIYDYIIVGGERVNCYEGKYY